MRQKETNGPIRDSEFENAGDNTPKRESAIGKIAG
jgi:hypothetical protein